VPPEARFGTATHSVGMHRQIPAGLQPQRQKTDRPQNLAPQRVRPLVLFRTLSGRRQDICKIHCSRHKIGQCLSPLIDQECRGTR
jgi:hypothetical protein